MSFLPLDMKYVTEEMNQKALEELGETQAKKLEGLTQLRKKVSEIPDLICPTDDNFLLIFLRFRKYDVAKAAECIKKFYLALLHNKEIFGDINFETIQKLYNEKILNPLPFRDQDGSAIVLICLDRFDFARINISALAMAVTVTEVFLLDCYPATQICGMRVIIDVTGLGLTHIKYIPVKYVVLTAKAYMGLLPIRYKSGHVINSSKVVQWLWNIAHSMLSDKLKKRLLFHSTEELTKYFDSTILPKEYGGSLDYNNEVWLMKLKEQEQRCYEIFQKGFKREI